jgi:putative transposase
MSDLVEWHSPAELVAAALPDLPTDSSALARRIKREGWQARRNMAGELLARRRDGRGGGWEYHYTVLPMRAQTTLVARWRAARKAAEQPARRGESELWDWYDRLPDTRKAKAEERRAALQEVAALERGGMLKNVAVCEVAKQRGVGKSSIYQWMALVAGYEPDDWLPVLTPRHIGKTETAECSPEAWEIIKSDYLRLSAPSFQSCYNRLMDVAPRKGWVVPTARTLLRRIEHEFPHAMIVKAREGDEKAKRLYPPIERTREMFIALEAVNADFHTLDLRVLWPDGTTGRASLIGVQDLYSNTLLSWRLDRAPNSTAVRLCFLDLFKEWGIPRYAFLDNGREFAAKLITGGQATRYRFKDNPADMFGVLTQLGVEVHWTLPYSGQSKPIERAWRELCDTVARHPEFEGAYTGNSPTNKPANYGSRAVPLADLLRVLGVEIDRYNRRLGRRTRVCGGVLSFEQAFVRSVEQHGLTRATEAQLRMVKLAASNVVARQPGGSVFLLENRYWSEFLTDHIGEKLTLRYDPDDLHSGVSVYRLNGAYLGDAECIEAKGFMDKTAARDQKAKERKFVKAQKALLEMEASLRPEQLAAMYAEAAAEHVPTAKPEAKVVRMVTLGNAAMKAEAAPDTLSRDEVTHLFSRALRLVVPQE